MKTEFLLQRGSNCFLPLDLFTETVEAELSQVKDQRKVFIKWLPSLDAAFPNPQTTPHCDRNTQTVLLPPWLVTSTWPPQIMKQWKIKKWRGK